MVITDGGGGAYVGTAEEILYCPVLPAEIVGTAGAGDAFASTFTASLALGWSNDHALRAATINAASVVGYVDTQTGLLRIDALNTAMKKHAKALPIRRWTI
jgi:ribokinase